MISYCDIFKRAVDNFNGNTAIIKYNNGSYDVYTYNQLQKASQNLFDTISTGFKTGEMIGIYSTHSAIIPALINMIHKCNCSFMFFDFNLDETSIKQVLTDMKIKKIFTIDKIIKVGEFSCIELSNVITEFNCRLYLWTDNSSESEYQKVENDVAYLIKTSGSTGVSKNVLVSHNSILPNVKDFKAIFKVSSSDIIYFSTPLTFDPSMIELYLAAECGAALMIAPPLTKVLFGNDSKYNITIWQTTPSLFLMFGVNEINNNVLNEHSHLRILALGGEPLTFDVFEIKSQSNQTEIYSLYGITEVSCWASVKRIIRWGNYMTEHGMCIGEMLGETFIQIWNDSNERVVNEIGNIVIGSSTRRCLVGEECSNYYETFGSLRSDTKAHLVWRNTGDLGKEVDSRIYFNGRCDRLIKRFGHKVNIVDIERVAFKFKGVKQCLCIWRESKSILALVYTSDEYIECSLWKYLSESLNNYSMPDDLIKIDVLPTNSHGKISLHKTEELYENVLKNRVNTSNKNINIFIMILNRYISNHLDIELIKHKSFINVGGTSIAAVQITNQLENYYNKTFPELYTYLLDAECPLDSVLEFLKNVSIDQDDNENKHNKRNYSTRVKSPKKQCIKSKLNFELVWSFNTGKCVDARIILHTVKSKQSYILIGSHSGLAVILNADSGQAHFSENLHSRIEAPFYCFENDFGSSAVVGCYDGSLWCFSIEHPKILWRIALESMIKSQACHFESNIFVGTYNGNLHTICINSGELVSCIKISSKGIAADLLGHKNDVFVGTLDGICSRVDVANENQILMWKKKLSSPIFAKPSLLKESEFVLFCEVNRKIHCLNSKSGDSIWIFDDVEGLIFSSCSVRTWAESDTIVFGCHDRHTYKLSSAASTKPTVDWRTKHAAEIYATPQIADDSSIVSVSTDGHLHLISASGEVISEYSLPGEVFSSPSVNKNFVYVGCRDDSVYCLKIV